MNENTEKSRSNDRRVRMTRQLLRNSLVELMKTKSLHEISIKKICENADVNRSTFYRYYDTQYDLYDEILSEISNDIKEIIAKHKQEENPVFSSLTDILTYTEEHRDLILVILSSNGSLVIGEMFSRNVNSYIDTDNTSELSMYCTQFVSAGLANILWSWLSKQERRSAKEVAMVINSLLLHGVKRAIIYSGKGEKKG